MRRAVCHCKLSSGLGWAVAGTASEARSKARLRARCKLRICARRWLDWWRWSTRLLRQRLAFHEQLDFSGIDDFTLKERLGDAFECLAIGGKKFLGAAIPGVDD